ncbi:MAG TPA: hypothetical protein VHE81_17410 [Lacipirellulaceae bacterium]|nr:hypothetical protein [Lacipirellulaceae bacterium]
MNPDLDKGGVAEEVLRRYFLAQGFFAVRGAKLRYEGYDVTDVDLYVYCRSSLYTRERGVVDIKRKRTPQAMERVLWAKGLQRVLSLDRCFVATTDNRAEVLKFGAEFGVVVLNGDFLKRLILVPHVHDRINEEEFSEQLDVGGVGKLGGDWRGIYDNSKSRLIQALSFDGFNRTLEDAKAGLEAVASSSSQGTGSMRLLYISVAHLLLTFDYIAQGLPQFELEERKRILTDGFRYGDSGKERSESVVQISATIATSLGGRFKNLGRSLSEEMARQYATIPVEMLAEFFSKASTLKNVFDLACAFEREAFAKLPRPVQSLSADEQSVIGVLSDFHGVDRKLVFGSLGTAGKPSAAARKDAPT